MFDFLNIKKIKIINERPGIFIYKLFLEKDKKQIISYINAYLFLELQKNNELKKFTEIFFLIPDGFGIYLMSRFLFGHKGLKERVVSTDVWIDIINICRQTDKKVFFYGGNKIDKKEFNNAINKRFPGLKIAGYADGYSSEGNKVFSEINKSGCDILFVGLGTPKQEKWTYENYRYLNVPVIITVGSAIDFISGFRKRAPEFIRKYALEWLYRLFQEPGRLWRRYLFGIPVFLFKMISLKFNLRKNDINN